MEAEERVELVAEHPELEGEAEKVLGKAMMEPRVAMEGGYMALEEAEETVLAKAKVECLEVQVVANKDMEEERE